MISKGGLNGQKNKRSSPVRPSGARVSATRPQQPRGMTVPRYFTRPGVDPFDQVEWELRTAAITGEGGQVFFEQKDVEFPAALVADGDQRRRAEVLPRRRRHAVARALGRAS